MNNSELKHDDSLSVDELEQISAGYELKNVMVTSFKPRRQQANNESPSENFALNFEEINLTYTE